MSALHAAWDKRHEATPPAWCIGRPSLHDERNEWQMYAFDPSEWPVMGRHSREWSTVAPSKEAVVHEMARCLREIAAGECRSRTL